MYAAAVMFVDVDAGVCHRLVLVAIGSLGGDFVSAVGCVLCVLSSRLWYRLLVFLLLLDAIVCGVARCWYCTGRYACLLGLSGCRGSTKPCKNKACSTSCLLFLVRCRQVCCVTSLVEAFLAVSTKSW
jgi:hypothetical protein